MRDLDVLDADARPMSVLGRREDGEFALAALLAIYRSEIGEVSRALRETLREIVGSERAAGVRVAEDLLDRERCVDGTNVNLDAISELTALWTRDLAANFLLIGLLPANRAGTRQVLKWSANWHIEPGAMKGGRQIAVAAGRDVAEIELPVRGAASAASFHLEVHLPPELAVARLELPPRTPGEAPACVDESGNPVAHVHAEYEEVPEQQDALIHVTVPWSGLRVTATVSVVLTGIMFLLGIVLPGATDALRSSGEGAAALLLVAPALMIAFSTRSQESIAVSRLLAPLRSVTVGCALLLVAAAASVVGGLERPWYDILWCVGAVLSVGVAWHLWRAPRALSDLRARLRRDKIWN